MTQDEFSLLRILTATPILCLLLSNSGNFDFQFVDTNLGKMNLNNILKC
jgi:hypothetical protein